MPATRVQTNRECARGRSNRMNGGSRVIFPQQGLFFRGAPVPASFVDLCRRKRPSSVRAPCVLEARSTTPSNSQASEQPVAAPQAQCQLRAAGDDANETSE
jgi:hypothetical protein